MLWPNFCLDPGSRRQQLNLFQLELLELNNNSYFL